MFKKSNGGKSFFKNLFGSIFDFNGDGKVDISEQWIAYKIFDDISEKRIDTSWRDTCEDGSEYDIYPEDYESEEEYEEALDYAKFGWRDYCEDGSEYDIYPEDYESEEEYEEALDYAKFGWRDYCEDGSEYDIYPEDYESEEEYEEALQDAKLDFE